MRNEAVNSGYRRIDGPEVLLSEGLVVPRRGGLEKLSGELGHAANPSKRRTYQRYAPGGSSLTTFPYFEPDLEKLYSI